MSKFVTRIPIDVHGVLELLPQRATPLDVRFNPSTCNVEIEWDDDDLVTPYSFPVEFPREQLAAGKVPDLVKVRPGSDIKPSRGRRYELERADRVEVGEQPTSRITVAPADVPTAALVDVEKPPQKKVKGRA